MNNRERVNMQFVTDNYIWFLIIGIVILMVVIGYIAEKTDFGHKGNNISKAKYSFGYGLETMANNKAPIMSANMQDCVADAQAIKGIRDWSYGPTQIKYEFSVKGLFSFAFLSKYVSALS